MIQFLQASKSYNKNQFALREVDLKISRGEFVFIHGPNGAGKTTLLKLVNVLEKPTSGEVILDGDTTAGMSRRKIAHLRRKTGVIFQDLKLLRGRTVEENVRIPLEVSGTPKSSHTVRLVKVLTYLDLLGKRDTFPEELSWGERQKVSIARAIINDPIILLADEPTEKLDRSTSEEIMETFREVHLWGTTVILASHDPDLPVKGVNRVVSLRSGELVDDVTVNNTAYDSVTR
jgi:cell division transport system ATP-binding protein